MIKRFANWYIKRVWEKEFVLREDIGKALVEAKRNEAERLQILHNAEKEELTKHFELEKILAVEELKAEIVQMEAEIADMVKKVKTSQQVYYKSVRRSKSNARVVLDMQLQSKKLLDLAGQIHGSIEGIKQRAFDHVENIEKEEQKDRENLGIDESKKKIPNK